MSDSLRTPLHPVAGYDSTVDGQAQAGGVTRGGRSLLGDLTSSHGEVQIPDIDDGGEEGAARFSWRLLWAYTGPGFLMSIAYLDPGNLESDLQAGATTGYELLWVLLWSTILGLLLQILAARLGVVTGKHLAQVCRENYTSGVSNMLWVMAEIAIIAGDIQQVIGSAIAFRLLFGLPLWAGVLITGADTFLFLALQSFGIRKLEAFFAVLITTMSVCFFINFGYQNPSASGIARGLVPGVSDYAVVQAVSILGAVIMPHNIFLHSALVQSRDVDRTKTWKVKQAAYYFSIEAALALLVSFLINMAVVSVFAAGFFDPECAKIKKAMVNGECDDIGLMGAGEALRGLLGNAAETIWAVGLLAAGQSSTMTGTFAGQYVMEGFLNLRLSPWKRVTLTRAVALVPAIAVALFATNEHTADTMDQYLNILQSIQLPFALLPILHFTSSKRIMGDTFANSWYAQVFLWLLTATVLTVNFFLVGSEVLDFEESGLPDEWWMYLLMAVALVLYVAALSVIVRQDFQFLWGLAKRKLGLDGGDAADVSDLLAAYDQPIEGSLAHQRMLHEEHGVLPPQQGGKNVNLTSAPADYQAMHDQAPPSGAPMHF